MLSPKVEIFHLANGSPYIWCLVRTKTLQGGQGENLKSNQLSFLHLVLKEGGKYWIKSKFLFVIST